MTARTLKPEEHYVETEPYYEPVGDEIEIFEAAWRNQLPVLLKGPTGCGKTRFMEHMAWRLGRPLITVPCAAGPSATWTRSSRPARTPRWSSTRWPTTAGCSPWRSAASCSRRRRSSASPSPTTPATRACSRTSSRARASASWRWSSTTRSRPEPELERRIVEKETGIEPELAERLVKFAHMTRNLKGSGLDEGASTRLLVQAAKLIVSGIPPVAACRAAVAQALTDDPEMLAAIHELSASLF